MAWEANILPTRSFLTGIKNVEILSSKQEFDDDLAYRLVTITCYYPSSPRELPTKLNYLFLY